MRDFILEVSNYTGLQITALAAYILRVSAQMRLNKSSVFVCNKSMRCPSTEV